MNLCEGMYGTSRSSYLSLDNAKMIVQHRGRIDLSHPNARTQQIASIFVENADGERYQFPTNDFAAARALTEAVNLGGALTYDYAKSREAATFDARALAENNSVVQDFVRWADAFAPERALLEYNDPYDTAAEDKWEHASEQAIHDFDPHEFLASEPAKEIMWHDPSVDPDVSRTDLKHALIAYLDQFMVSHSGDYDDGFNGDNTDTAEMVWDKLVDAMEQAGYVINHDDGSSSEMESLEPLAGDDTVLTREDVLLPNPNQGAGLSREVTKSVVHDDPTQPDEEHFASPSYTSRLRALAGMNTARTY